MAETSGGAWLEGHDGHPDSSGPRKPRGGAVRSLSKRVWPGTRRLYFLHRVRRNEAGGPALFHGGSGVLEASAELGATDRCGDLGSRKRAPNIGSGPGFPSDESSRADRQAAEDHSPRELRRGTESVGSKRIHPLFSGKRRVTDCCELLFAGF